jgi:hypothetical protein
MRANASGFAWLGSSVVFLGLVVGCGDASTSASSTGADAGEPATAADATPGTDGESNATDAAADAGVTADANTDASPTADATSNADASPTADAASNADASSTADASANADAAPSDAGTADAAASVLCGRYRVIDPGTGSASGACPGPSCDGSGLVADPRNGLVWQRFRYLPAGGQTLAQATAYCTAKGMRLPTQPQASAIAGGTGTCQEAWPAGWTTWTSTTVNGTEAFVVDSGGLALRTRTNQSEAVLCVRSNGPQ